MSNELENGDALDQLLQDYLLERDPQGLNGESLMQEAALGEMGRGPSLMPNSQREAEMEARLKEAIRNQQGSRPVRPGKVLRLAITGSIAATLLLTAGFFLTRNHDASTGAPIAQVRPVKFENGKVEMAPAPIFAEEKNNSLLNSFLNPPSAPGEKVSTRPEKESQTLASLWNLSTPGPLGPEVSFPADEVNFTFSEQANNQMLGQIAPQAQLLTLHNQAGATLRTRQGSTLIIPGNCFATLDGKIASGEIQVRVSEAYSPSEMLRAGMNHYASGSFFTSGGAILVQASQMGKELKITSGKEIYVEMPQVAYLKGTEVFASTDATAPERWVRQAGKENTMVPLPLDKLYFEQFWCRDHRDGEWNDLIVQLANPSHENTYIATLQFRERVKAAWDLGHNGALLSIYLNNVGKELWQVDEMVAEYTKNQKVMGDFVPPFDGHRKFKTFALQGFTRALPYNDRGIQPGKAGARNAYLAMGLNDAQVDDLQRMESLRNMYVEQLENSILVNRTHKSARIRTPEQSPAVAVNRGLRMTQTGWMAIGRTFTPSDDQDIEINLSQFSNAEIAGVYFISGNSITAAEPVAPGKASVPSTGSSGWVVALGYQNGLPVIGMQQVAPHDETASLSLRSVSIDQLRESLRALDN